jgi:hypothetical protein
MAVQSARMTRESEDYDFVASAGFTALRFPGGITTLGPSEIEWLIQHSTMKSTYGFVLTGQTPPATEHRAFCVPERSHRNLDLAQHDG